MKNYSVLSALMIGIIFASCSNDEPVVSGLDATKNQINFAVTADNGSRSSSSYGTGLDIKSFTVSAWLQEDPTAFAPNYGEVNSGSAPYFVNDQLARIEGSGLFNYVSNARFWPANGETLDFFAVVDNNAPEWNGAGAFSFLPTGPQLGWISQLGIDKMPDMLYAYTPNQKRANDNKPQQNVSFQFKHAFAKVIVTAEVRNENIRVCLTDMEVCGIIDEGRFVFPHKEDQSGNVVISEPKWDLRSNGSFTNVSVPLTPFSQSNPLILDKGYGVSSHTLVGAGEGKLKDLLVIPNTYSGRNSSGKYQTYIKLKGYAYNIANAENGFNEEADALIFPKKNADGSVTPADIIIPIEFNWQMGTVNHYNIVFDCGNGGSTTTDPNTPAFVRIGYEVEVKDWNTGEVISPIEYKK